MELAPDEVQLDRPIGVGVRRREEFVGHVNVDGQFLLQLARETRGVRFARLTFPAGKFPAPFEVRAL